jgi:hypothetical protein
MKKFGPMIAAVTLSVSLSSFLALAQNPAPQNQAPPMPMRFFVTSVGLSKGADLGGLAGADAHCTALANAAKPGNNMTWHAYLSTQASGNQPAISARDRIGNGPWHNSKGVLVANNLGHLHGDTLEQARLGNGLTKNANLNEKGELVNGQGDMPNRHDILTGSTTDGKAFTDAADHTCSNWTSSTAGSGSGQVGHHDRSGGGNNSWNSSHPSRGCSQENLVATGGAGFLYCFATN